MMKNGKETKGKTKRGRTKNWKKNEGKWEEGHIFGSVLGKFYGIILKHELKKKTTHFPLIRLEILISYPSEFKFHTTSTIWSFTRS